MRANSGGQGLGAGYRWDGKLQRGLRYQDIGHGPGSILWWWDGAALTQHISRGRATDNHAARMPCDPDQLWRGRYEAERDVVSIEPKLHAFVSGALPPRELLDRLIAEFAPKHIVVDSKQGFVRRIIVEESHARASTSPCAQSSEGIESGSLPVAGDRAS